MSDLRELAREHPEEFKKVAEYVGPKTRKRMLKILNEENPDSDED